MNELFNKYDNLIGKISIKDTNFSTLFFQSNDNDYYLKHSYDGKKNEGGEVFLDYRVSLSSKKIIIYGHNSLYFNLPFKYLENYYEQDFYLKNKFIVIESKDVLSTYEIFSVFIETSNYSYTRINFRDDEWLEHLNYLKDKSWYKSDIELTNDDNILILQTCSYKKEYFKYKNKYLIIVAKRI